MAGSQWSREAPTAAHRLGDPGSIRVEPSVDASEQPEGDRRAWWWFGPTMLAMAIVFVVLTIAGWQNGLALVDHGAVATGTVFAKDISSDDGYRLSFEFTTADGARRRDADSVSREAYEAVAVGDAVMVTYLAENPIVNVIGPAKPPSPWLLVLVIPFELLFAIVGGWASLRDLSRWMERRA